MVLVQFEVVFGGWYWFGGEFVKKEKCWVFKGNAVKTPVLVLTID